MANDDNQRQNYTLNKYNEAVYTRKKLTRIKCRNCRREDFLNDFQLNIFKASRRRNSYYCSSCFWKRAAGGESGETLNDSAADVSTQGEASSVTNSPETP